MLDESIMIGKRIKRVEVGGFGVYIVLEDGTIFDYTSSSGGNSYWDIYCQQSKNGGINEFRNRKGNV